MTTTELVTAGVCLVFGYWVVALIMKTPKSRRPEQQKAHPDASSNQRQDSDETNAGAEQQSHQAPPNPDERSLLHWYEVLDVTETSSREEISAAYKRQIRQYHPDRVAQMGKDIRDLAELRAKQINAAYVFALKLRDA